MIYEKKWSAWLLSHFLFDFRPNVGTKLSQNYRQGINKIKRRYKRERKRERESNVERVINENDKNGKREWNIQRFEELTLKEEI